MPGPSRLGLELEMPVLLSLVLALLTLVPCSYFCYLGSCRNGMRENVVNTAGTHQLKGHPFRVMSANWYLARQNRKKEIIVCGF